MGQLDSGPAEKSVVTSGQKSPIYDCLIGQVRPNFSSRAWARTRRPAHAFYSIK
jgi:hypothetical protein